MKAPLRLKLNIRAMLKAREQTPHDLAFALGHDDSWASKFLSDKPPKVGEKIKGVPLTALDDIAAFFGVAVYQLFQPGISHLTERRKGHERRVNPDRRITANRGDLPATPTKAIRVTPEDETVLGELHELTYEQYQRVRGWIAVARFGSRSSGRDTAPPDTPRLEEPPSDGITPRVRAFRKKRK